MILLVLSAAAQPRYDLLLKGGHVIDAKNRIDAVRDVAIEGGQDRARRREDRPRRGAKVVDVAGLYVTPGLIDIHVHVYKRTNPPPRAQDESVNPDAFSFRSGVTTDGRRGILRLGRISPISATTSSRRRARACWRS